MSFETHIAQVDHLSSCEDQTGINLFVDLSYLGLNGNSSSILVCEAAASLIFVW